MSARQAKAIRRRARARSANRNGLGVSELFTAPVEDAKAILAAADLRLKKYLLGY